MPVSSKDGKGWAVRVEAVGDAMKAGGRVGDMAGSIESTRSTIDPGYGRGGGVNGGSVTNVGIY